MTQTITLRIAPARFKAPPRRKQSQLRRRRYSRRGDRQGDSRYPIRTADSTAI